MLTDALSFALSGWRLSIAFLLPAAILSEALHLSPVLTFSAAALALVPLASLLGDATEEVAAHVGTAAGGLLNATLSNITELVISLVALWYGHIQVVKPSITGSIIGNRGTGGLRWGSRPRKSPLQQRRRRCQYADVVCRCGGARHAGALSALCLPVARTRRTEHRAPQHLYRHGTPHRLWR